MVVSAGGDYDYSMVRSRLVAQSQGFSDDSGKFRWVGGSIVPLPHADSETSISQVSKGDRHVVFSPSSKRACEPTNYFVRVSQQYLSGPESEAELQ